jgi:DNA-binding NtrC family response regulator
MRFLDEGGRIDDSHFVRNISEATNQRRRNWFSLHAVLPGQAFGPAARRTGRMACSTGAMTPPALFQASNLWLTPRSLRMRLILLWIAVAAACGVAAYLMWQLAQISLSAQIDRADAILGRSCSNIAERYRFYSSGWRGTEDLRSAELQRNFLAVIDLALRGEPGVEGGIWQNEAGSLAYGYPTYEGGGVKTDIPAAELDRIQAINQRAARDDEAREARFNGPSQTLLLRACPLPGPVSGLTGWTMTRVFHAAWAGYGKLRIGLILLFGCVAIAAVLGTRILMVWSRHIHGIERTLEAGGLDLPPLQMTGERELDRIIAALNHAGEHLTEARQEKERLNRQVAAADRLAAIGRLAAAGETGTGKEVVAQAIHRFGERASKPFVALNCAAIPSELMESELFGHARGAFTGAAAERAGAFAEADGGILFLDEIGDMPYAMQGKMLRALQESVITPIGGRPRKVDVRVLAATHQNLAQAVENGRFREDLLYRLNVVPIHIPPLRERAEDIAPLARHFLSAAGVANKTLSHDAERLLAACPWPGNVRQLKNAVTRAATLSQGSAITAQDFAFLLDAERPARSGPAGDDLPGAVEQLEIAMIRKVLAATQGNRAEAARRLNIPRQQLYAKLKKYGL